MIQVEDDEVRESINNDERKFLPPKHMANIMNQSKDDANITEVSNDHRFDDQSFRNTRILEDAYKSGFMDIKDDDEDVVNISPQSSKYQKIITREPLKLQKQMVLEDSQLIQSAQLKNQTLNPSENSSARTTVKRVRNPNSVFRSTTKLSRDKTSRFTATATEDLLKTSRPFNNIESLSNNQVSNSNMYRSEVEVTSDHPYDKKVDINQNTQAMFQKSTPNVVLADTLRTTGFSNKKPLVPPNRKSSTDAFDSGLVKQHRDEIYLCLPFLQTHPARF